MGKVFEILIFRKFNASGPGRAGIVLTGPVLSRPVLFFLRWHWIRKGKTGQEMTGLEKGIDYQTCQRRTRRGGLIANRSPCLFLSCLPQYIPCVEFGKGRAIKDQTRED